MSRPTIFWREGDYTAGRSGYYVRATSLRKAVKHFTEQGHTVVGIIFDDDDAEDLINLIIDTPYREELVS